MSVLSLVTDPQFMRLTPSDQQAALAGLDPDFSKLNSSDFGATVSALQKQAMSRPDLVTPPQAVSGLNQNRAMTNTINQDLGGGNHYEAAANEQTPEGHAVAVAQREAENPTISTVGHVASGFVKGAGQTLAPGPRTAAAINAATGMNVPSTQSAELQPNGTAENIGYGAEGIAEFVLGDELLKSAQLGDKLLKVGKVAETYEKASPFVKKAIEAGMNIARTTTVSAAQSGLHGQDVATGALTGAIGGAVGEGIGAIGERFIQPRTTAAAAENAKEALDAIRINQIKSANDVSDIASKAFESATGVVPEEAPQTLAEAADGIRQQFDPVYDKLREATKLSDGGNAFDIARNQVAAAKKVLFNPSSVEAATEAQKVLDSNPLDRLFANPPAGISQEDLIQAGKAWRKAATLDDIHSAIEKAYTESPNLTASRSMTALTWPEINAKAYVTRVNNVFNKIPTADIRSALGPEGFSSLQEVTANLTRAVNNEAYGKSVTQLTKQYLANKGMSSVSKTLGGPAIGGTVGTAAHFLVGASNPVAAGIGLTAATAHFLYTHPDIGIAVTRAASKAAPVVAQGVKQVTHVFNPETQKAEPVQ